MTDTASQLIVPVTVDALAVTDAVRLRGGRGFRRWVPEYKLLHYNATPEPRAFSNDTSWNSKNSSQYLDNGVVVRWQLPAGLRHGRPRTPGGRSEFPLVPNRWLVVRRVGTDQTKAGAWLVESDYLDSRKGASPFVHPVKNGADEPTKTPYRSTLVTTRIGRATDIGPSAQAWTEPAAKHRKELFLTAVGPGLMTFHIFEPYHRNVFSLHDPLTGLSSGAVDYQVIGWYSDSGQEELIRLLDLNQKKTQKQTLAEVLADLGWQVSTDTSASWTPTSTLYCGRIAGIDWKPGAPQPPDSDFPEKTKITIAFGSSADEAAAAKPDLFKAGDDAAHLLHMFAAGHLDTLDGPDGDILAAQDTHRSWFEQRAGGTAWRLVPTTNPNGNAPRNPAEVTWSTASSAAEKLLADLNTCQRDLDEAQRELRALQQRLYTLWWMHGRPLLPPQYTREQFYQEIAETGAGKTATTECGRLADEVVRRRKQVADYATRLAKATEALTEHNATTQGGWELRSEALPSFWQATDPTVVLGQTRGGKPHSALTTSTAPGSLLNCRTHTQLLGDHSLPAEFAKLHLDNLPSLVPDLLAEFVHLIGKPGPNVPEDLKCPTWRQPWKPLLYQWKVRYWHVPHTDQESKKANWEFDGGRYTWTNGAPDPHLGRNEIIGRRFLVPLPQHKMVAVARQYAAEAGPDEEGRRLAAAFTAFADTVAQADVLSQRTDGLTDALAGRDKAPNLSPPGRVGELVGDAFDHLPDPGPLPLPFEGWQASGFTQIRAGQFAVAALTVVDEFGQSLDAVLQKDSDLVTPLIGDSLKPNGRYAESTRKDRFVQLPPRLLQPARLRFDFVSQNDKTRYVDMSAGTTPVGAWIVPNYVDRALLCYAADGKPLGELRPQLTLAEEKVTTVVAWSPLPDSAVHTLDQLKKDQPVLHDFATELVAKGQTAFLELLATIAHVLHGIDPGNPYGDDVMGTLLGRPLALARARMGIELEGPPVSDPGWEHALDWQALTQWRKRVKDNNGKPPATMSHLELHWPIRLGNAGQLGDGLIGYFTEPNQTADTTESAFTDYATFYAVDTAPDTKQTGYIKKIAADNWHRLPADSTTHTYLTVLFDPQAAVHATTDLLPVTPLQLPARFTRAALAAMQTALRLSPVLTAPRAVPDPDAKPNKSAFTTALALPHPTAARGAWNWSELNTTEAGKPPAWHQEPLVQIDETARLDEDHPTVRTGYLRLTGGFLD
ncbi:hypothetical protein [Streptomyces sp. NPDC002490]|uniref:hypothetical protein n=1 Tax=Streptomyces sp. NPDC002490 TaxID=3154416 RepID=UPI0033205444